MEQEGHSWNVSELNLLNSAEAADGDSPRCSISGLPLTPLQLRLRRLRKRLVLWFLFCALLLCGSETLSRQAFYGGRLRLPFSLFGDLLIAVLWIQFSLIVETFCCDLSK